MPCVFILLCSWRNEPAARPRSCDGHSRYHPQGPTGWDRRTIVLDLYAFLMQRMFGEHWRARAEEARSMAEQLSDPESKRTMLRIADDYERLAEHADLRARRQSSRA